MTWVELKTELFPVMYSGIHDSCLLPIGGTINDDEEFSGATFNLVFKLGLAVDYAVVQQRIDAVGEVNDDNAWSFEEFIDWFRINFM